MTDDPVPRSDTDEQSSETTTTNDGMIRRKGGTMTTVKRVKAIEKELFEAINVNEKDVEDSIRAILTKHILAAQREAAKEMCEQCAQLVERTPPTDNTLSWRPMEARIRALRFTLSTLPDATYTDPDCVVPIPDSRSRTKIIKEAKSGSHPGGGCGVVTSAWNDANTRRD